MPIFFKKLITNPVEVSALFIIIFTSFFILANFFAGFIWSLYLLAMGIGFFISVFYPKSGMLAMIFLTMIFERFFTLQSVFLGKSEYKIYPVDIVMLGMMAGIGKEFLLKGNWRSAWNKLKGKPSVALVAFILLNGIYFFVSVLFLESDFSASFSTLKNYAFYSLLYFCALWLINTKEDIEKIVRFFFLGALGIIVFIFIGLVRGEGLWSEYTPLSTMGARTLAFTHGLYLSLILIPALLYLALFQSQRRWYFLVGVWLAGIAGTMMRHLWIALAVSGGITYSLLSHSQRKAVSRVIGRFFLIASMMIIVVFYAIVLFLQSRVNTLGQEVTQVFGERIATLSSLQKDESYAWRSVVWHGAYELYKRNPLFGIGTGQKVSVELENYRDFVEVKNLHNSYLTILIQFGFLGLVLFLYFVYTSIAESIRHLRRSNYDWRQLSVLSILGIYLVSFVFQPYLETNLLSVFFWMSLGIGKALKKDL